MYGLGVFLNQIKVQSKEKNLAIDSIKSIDILLSGNKMGEALFMCVYVCFFFLVFSFFSLSKKNL